MNKLPDRLVLEIVTPERQVIKAVVDEVVLPGAIGYLGILPGHTPLLTTLSIGTVTYRQKEKKFYLFLSEGFAEILPDRVIVLAEVVEKPEEINLERAKLAKERAEKRLGERTKDTNVDRAMTSLKRAISRIDVGVRH